VNGAIVELYGFAVREKAVPGEPLDPTQCCMLIQVNEDRHIQREGLPPNVVALDNERFTFNAGHHRSVTIRQFPVTLAFVITDYKCQGQTYQFVLADLKKPIRGGSPASSLYVQLSRCRSLNNLSIMRPFQADELCTSLSSELLTELEWQENLAEQTKANPFI
jgi:hypothetical protein